MVNAWGGENLGMCVCKRTVVRFLFFLAPRSLQAEKAKGQGRLPWPFSRGCQTYWEACQKCGAPRGEASRASVEPSGAYLGPTRSPL